MTKAEDLIRSTTRALAARVEDVPPLRLEPGTDELSSPGYERGRAWRGPALGNWRSPAVGRWRSRLAPVIVAALVAAIAIAVVVIKSLPNGGVVPASTSAAGIPRYYVALSPTSSSVDSVKDLLVGDSVTGKTLATFDPPSGTSFASLSAAGDDRTFVVLDVTNPGKPQAQQTDTWFEVRLSPGSAQPATLTRTPVAARNGVVATALSASGTELAVAQVDSGSGQRSLVVLSMASGQELADWSAADLTFTPSTYHDTEQSPSLTWVDNDQALTIVTYTDSDQGVATGETLRRVNVGASAGSDLTQASQVVWAVQAGSQPTPCELNAPLVNADGSAVICAAVSSPLSAAAATTWVLSWGKYQTSAQQPDASAPVTLYQITRSEPTSTQGNGAYSSALTAGYGGTLWASPSGSTFIVSWAVDSIKVPQNTPSLSTSNAADGSAPVILVDPVTTPDGLTLHVGVVSNGKYSVLRLPAQVLEQAAQPTGIAW